MMTPARVAQRLRLAATSHPQLFEFIVAPLVLACLFLCACGRFLGGDRSIATFQDNTHFYLPLFHHISRSFARGEYPYWIANIVGGIPLYNSPQFPLTYPLYFYHSGLYATPLDALVEMHYLIFLHIFIAYLNCYVLLRVLRVRPLAALLGASAFAFSANTANYSFWINILAPYVWMPLIIAGVVLVLENRHRKVGVLTGAAALALLIHASPAQPLIHAAYLIGVLYLFSAARRLWQKEFALLWATTRNLLVMGVVAFLLSASALVPVLVNTKNMVRFIGDGPPVIGFEPIPFAGFIIGQLSMRQLAGALLPLELPAGIGEPYVGPAVALFALFALFRLKRNWLVAPLLFLTIYGLLAATGDQLGLAQLNYRLPLLNKIREPGRHLFLFVLSVSCLAAIGFDYLLARLRGGYRAALSVWQLLPVALTLALLYAAARAGLAYKGEVPKFVFLALFAVVCALLFVLPRLGARARRSVAALVVLGVIYANLQYPWVVPPLARGDYFEAQNLVSHKVLAELAQLPDAHDYRVFFADKTWNTQYWPMNAIYYDLRGLEAFMNPQPSAQQFAEIYQYAYLRHYYPLLGTKYFVCKPCDDAALADYKLTRVIEGYSLYVNEQALPRYTLLNRVAGTYANAGDFYNKINAGYDYAHECYLTTADAPRVQGWLGAQTGAPHYLLKPERATLNKLTVSVHTEGRALFLLNEYYRKDWQARVNGRPVPLVLVNLNQMGVLLEAGGSLVEFEYRPVLYIWLLRLSKLTLGALLLYVCAPLYTRYRRKRRRAPGVVG